MTDASPKLPGRLKAHWKLAVGVGVLVVIASAGLASYLTGIATFERHRGFFAPVWGEDGRTIYFVERETRGFIWGLGWEFFSPPANAYVVSDRVGLRRMNLWDAAAEPIADFTGGALEGRTTQHYRGRIFGILRARLTPEKGGLRFRIGMDIPKVPRSEQWALTGLGNEGAKPQAQWEKAWPGQMGGGEDVLRGGVELIAIGGRESYPAAILAVSADGSVRVLAKNDHFRSLYPSGVPPRLIAEASQRKRIEQARQLRRLQAELMAKHRSSGMSETAARLKTHDELERLGYYARSPRIVATKLAKAPEGVRVFIIPRQRFEVGLYRDLAEAIAKPGTMVRTDTGSYLKYGNDLTGPDLKAWRRAGNDRFAVQVGATLYLLTVKRFKPGSQAGTTAGK
jgi:hypothetical protein